MKRFSTFLLVTSMVVICCIPLHLNSSAAEIKPIITHPILVENDLFSILNSDYCPVLSNASLMSTSNNDSNEWPHTDLNDIKSTSGIPITTAVSYIGDYTPEEAEYEQWRFELTCLLDNIFIDAIAPTPTVNYNCHTYAWYGVPSEGSCWIKDPSEFFGDPHCDRITDNICDDSVQEGDIVYFYSETEGAVHSSIVDSISYDNGQKIIKLQSKFGPYGVYVHYYEDTDYFYDYSDYTVYRYIQDEHDLYMYSAAPEDYVVKCHDCTYTVECWESPEYYGNSSDGHWVDCSCGCYSFFEPHTPGSYSSTEEGYHEIECADCGYLYTEDCNYGGAEAGNSSYHFFECTDCGYERAEAHVFTYTMIANNVFKHNAYCRVCQTPYEKPHNWVSVSGGYRCSDCRMPTSIIPGEIMNLSDEELSLLLSSMSEDEIEQFIALLPEDAVARVTAILPPDDEHLTE